MSTPSMRLMVLAILFGSLVAQSSAAVQAISVGCPVISVGSLDRSVDFYTTVLGFKASAEGSASSSDGTERSASHTKHASYAHLVLGEECLDLAEYQAPRGKPFPLDSASNDLWFEHVAIVVSDIDKAYSHLREAHVRFVSNLPQVLPEWNKDASGIAAFYFRDPDGHYLELIHFPAGKGQAKWQAPTSSLFLGIDHTAIAVSDTDGSIAFYRDQLGFRIVGTSENFGAEQEHLSGVFNAHVLITSLRADSGIGIELLGYLSPTTGRPAPKSQKPNDLATWQVPIDVKATTAGEGFSPLGTLHWERTQGSQRSGGLTAAVKDPDGHILKLIKHE